MAKQGNPTARQTSRLACRVATHLETAGWRLERLPSDNGNEFKGVFNTTVESLGAKAHPHPCRAQTNGNVEALHETILDECRGLPLPATCSLAWVA
jgi:hypothetical protein